MSAAVARPPRLAMLSGAVFVVLLIVAFAVLGGETPDENASARKVFTFYTDHQSRQIAAAIVVAASVPFLMIFSAVLHRTLRAFEGPVGGSPRLPSAAAWWPPRASSSGQAFTWRSRRRRMRRQSLLPTP